MVQGTANHRDPRHNPDKALELIKAAHRGGGRPADENHIEMVRNGWVQTVRADEVIITRNGKTGYRTSGVNSGPLREMSLLERRLREQEQAFLRQLGRYGTLDHTFLRLAAHRQTASRNGVLKRRERAHQVENVVTNLYLTSKLPIHQRVSSIAAKLKRSVYEISVRRVRQIVRTRILLSSMKSGNDRD